MPEAIMRELNNQLRNKVILSVDIEDLGTTWVFKFQDGSESRLTSRNGSIYGTVTDSKNCYRQTSCK